jgi:hypothetical protein
MQTARPLCRQLGLLCLVALLLVRTTLAQVPNPEASAKLYGVLQEPITLDAFLGHLREIAKPDVAMRSAAARLSQPVTLRENLVEQFKSNNALL